MRLSVLIVFALATGCASPEVIAPVTECSQEEPFDGCTVPDDCMVLPILCQGDLQCIANICVCANGQKP